MGMWRNGSAGPLQGQGWGFKSSHLHISKYSSFGRASAFQAEGGQFEPGYLLNKGSRWMYICQHPGSENKYYCHWVYYRWFGVENG